MSSAVFTSSLTYTPGGGGSLTQSFGVNVPYTAVSSGTIDIPGATAAATAFLIPFGGVNVDARGLMIKNNTDLDVGIRFNTSMTDSYHLAPGGVLMHWAPAAAAAPASALKGASIATTALTVNAGTIDYIVLGN